VGAKRHARASTKVEAFWSPKKEPDFISSGTRSLHLPPMFWIFEFRNLHFCTIQYAISLREQFNSPSNYHISKILRNQT